MNTNYPDDISLSFLKKELLGYRWDALRQDLIAGIQVALMTIPQAMAYALVAGLPISCGLFAAIFASIVAALCGSSRYLVVGPINGISILVQSGTADLLYTYYRDVTGPEREALALQIMLQMALLAGLFQIIAGMLKLGRLTQFVSHSVVIGYLVGGACAIVMNQLFTFTGIPVANGLFSLYDKGAYIVTHLNQLQWLNFGVGAVSLLFLIALPRINQKFPAAALTLCCASGIVFTLLTFFPEWLPENLPLIGQGGDPYTLLPPIGLPAFDPGLMKYLISIAFAIALLSIMETTCSTKNMAAASGHRISINQEILSVGLANVASAFTGSMPVSVSSSRSISNFNFGAQTRFSMIFNALFVASIVYLFGFFINLIPMPVLASLLFMVAVNLVNRKQFLLCLKATSADAFVLLITILSCIFLGLDTAFYIGVALSIILYLKKAALPQLVEYIIEDNGELKRIGLNQLYMQMKIRVIKIEGELFFGAADIFHTTLKSIAEDDTSTRAIVLQLKNARDLDATSCLALIQLHDYLKSAGRHLIACGMTQEVWDVMSNSGIIAQLGKENLFMFDERYPQLHMQKAIKRAKYLVTNEAAIKVPEPIIVEEKGFEIAQTQAPLVT